MKASHPSARTIALLLPMLLTLSACEPLSVLMLGAGANAGISHQMNGLAYRTFTAPLPRVKAAATVALKRMKIRVESTEKTGSGEILYARAPNRQIEVEFEAITSTTTRVRAVARQDFLLVDSATALEIISQTGKAMGS